MLTKVDTCADRQAFLLQDYKNNAYCFTVLFVLAFSLLSSRAL
jgi:hypothetical protein